MKDGIDFYLYKQYSNSFAQPIIDLNLISDLIWLII